MHSAARELANQGEDTTDLLAVGEPRRFVYVIHWCALNYTEPIIRPMVTPESLAIPYEAKDLRGERLLVLAPHPDDEVIGCGGLISLHSRRGRPVDVVIVADGAEAGDATVRREESRRGLSIIGNATVDFLNYADRKLD